MRAGNQIEAAGAASLAPSLLWMTQLTSLDLSGTLRAIGWACAVANAGNVVTMLRAVGRLNHIDDSTRIIKYQNWLNASLPIELNN